MNTKLLYTAVAADALPKDFRGYKAASVPAAIVRYLAVAGGERTLAEVMSGFADSYLSENRELPRSGVLRDNPELYFFDYLKFLVKEGAVAKKPYAPVEEQEAPEISKKKK